MALTTYSELKAEIATWLDRDATELDAALYVTLAETHFWDHLRLRAMKTALSTTIVAAGTAPIPSDFRELSYAYVDGSPAQSLDISQPDDVVREYPTRSAEGKPCVIAEDGDNFIFGPFPDSTYTIAGTYYAPLTALSDSNAENWILLNAPQLYLYRSLMVGEMWVGNKTGADHWATLYMAAEAQVETSNRRARHPSDMPVVSRLA